METQYVTDIAIEGISKKRESIVKNRFFRWVMKLTKNNPKFIYNALPKVYLIHNFKLTGLSVIDSDNDINSKEQWKDAFGKTIDVNWDFTDKK